MSRPIQLSFHGAAGTVTGSRHLLEVGSSKVLVDAGLFQGSKDLRLRNWSPPPFEPRSIGRVLITHSHIDHLGYLPRLVSQGLSAPVLCTPAARELGGLTLLDSAKIQEEDARYANRKGHTKHRPALPLYTTEDAEASFGLMQAVRYGTWQTLDPSSRVHARFHNAGHILGSAFVEVRIDQEGDELRIVFSGDLGRYGVPLHPDPDPLPECDVLVVESTYGDRDHASRPFIEEVREPFQRCLRDGGTILIPAFAIGRSQLTTLMLRRLMQSGDLPEVPIHIDSPMAVDATRIYSQHLDARNLDPDVFEDGRLRLFPSRVNLHRSVDESKKLNDLPGPRVIVSSSGMLSGGRVLHHLRRLAPDPKNLVVLVGYQAGGTRGRAMLEGADTIKIHGRHVPVRARCMTVSGLSGHADRGELMRWVGRARRPPRTIFCVHGEPDAADAFARSLAERFGSRCRTPRLGDRFDLRES